MRLTVVHFFAGLVGLALGAGLRASPALAQTRLDRPMSEVQAAFDKLLRCRDWAGTADSVQCQSFQIWGALDLTRDPADGSVETIDFNTQIVSEPKRPRREARDRKTTLQIFRYLFPAWRGRDAWVSKALDDARRTHMKSLTKVDGVTILVQFLRPADIEGEEALIVMTKQPRVDHWIIGGTD